MENELMTTGFDVMEERLAVNLLFGPEMTP
jgi:hypothetical protein